MLGWQRTYSASDLKRIAMGTMVLDHLAFHLMERGGTDLPMAWYILGTAMRLFLFMVFFWSRAFSTQETGESI